MPKDSMIIFNDRRSGWAGRHSDGYYGGSRRKASVGGGMANPMLGAKEPAIREKIPGRDAACLFATAPGAKRVYGV